jgi:hypothetical protein
MRRQRECGEKGYYLCASLTSGGEIREVFSWVPQLYGGGKRNESYAYAYFIQTSNLFLEEMDVGSDRKGAERKERFFNEDRSPLSLTFKGVKGVPILRGFFLGSCQAVIGATFVGFFS